MDLAGWNEFGRKYTAAWCSRDAARVASFFAENGSLTINDGPPSVGRSAIAAAAQGFMSAFPDMVVTMDGLRVEGKRAVYRWTLNGRNTGPGGTGNAVRISGYEEWTLGTDGLIAASRGRFDEAEYDRQLTAGTSRSGSADHWGPLWGARPLSWAALEGRQRPTYDEAIRCLPIEPGTRVLDVGCGAGTFLRMASERGARVFGIDASQDLVDLARKRLPGADLRVGDMEALPYDDASFDLVTGFNSFFFAADMVGALREAGRVATAGAPVWMQVWGRPEHCRLGVALKQAMDSVVAPPEPPAASGPKLWEPGALEAIAVKAGLVPEGRFVTTWAFEFPDLETMQEELLAPALVTIAVRQVGEPRVREAIRDAFAPYRTGDGGYRLENEWCSLLAHAR
jgi:uncharacterized protein (TIGR02246 family)